MTYTPQLPLLPLVLDEVPSALRRLLAQEGVPFCNAAADEPSGGRFVLFDAALRSKPNLRPGQVAIDLDRLRAGWATDPFAALDDERTRRCGWRLGSLTVSEVVARVDKRALRWRLMTGLQALIESAGGVWLKLSPFPAPYRGAFNFRFDHDEYDPHDFDAVLSAVNGHEHSASHYVCASTHAAHPEALARLKSQHVGSHGHWHHTYRDSDDNVRNIQAGIEALRAGGLEPEGFVAPHGRFNRGLLAAMTALGIKHSSEFGLAYDDLPFFPDGSDVLQVPIHPVCLGICLDAARESREMHMTADSAANMALAHLLRTIDDKWQAGEPIFLYGHPNGRLGRYPHVLRLVLQHASGLNAIWQTTLAQFADWWRARAEATFTARREGDRLVVSLICQPARYHVSIDYCRGQQMATLPLSGSRLVLSPDSPDLQWRPIHASCQPRRFDLPEGIRSGLRRFLDWEHVTPLDQISRRTWRGWAKRTLRRIQRPASRQSGVVR